jgi:hypothetical protein
MKPEISASAATLEQIPVDRIDRNPQNPRIIFRGEELNQLLKSIRTRGVQVPISVYKEGSRFVLIDGERRWRCAIKLNRTTIPALIQKKPDSVVIDCATRAIPVKLFLAFPEPSAPVPHQVVEKIHKKGLGLIEVRAAGPVALIEALPLSLFGYRLDRFRFPARIRGTLLEADNTFRSGSPPKACAVIYEEIEDLSRELVKKT